MIRILICEDNPEVYQRLADALRDLVLAGDKAVEIEVLTTAQQVVDQANHQSGDYYDLILLDYYAPDGSFHALDIEKLGPDKVIAISLIPSKNQQALDRGAASSITKSNPLTDENVELILAKAEHILYDN